MRWSCVVYTYITQGIMGIHNNGYNFLFFVMRIHNVGFTIWWVVWLSSMSMIFPQTWMGTPVLFWTITSILYIYITLVGSTYVVICWSKLTHKDNSHHHPIDSICCVLWNCAQPYGMVLTDSQKTNGWRVGQPRGSSIPMARYPFLI